MRDEEFHEFVVARSDAMLRSAYLLTHDWGQAEDLLQTAFAKAWFARDRITYGAEAYTRTVLVNTYASWWRRRWRLEIPTATLPEKHGTDHTTQVDDHDAMWRALGALPRQQRAVLVLRYYEGLSEAEIAAALGCSTGTVKSQASKALAKLRGSHASEPAAITNVEERSSQ